MAALITATEAKQRLRIDFDDENTVVASMIEEATDIIINYIKKPNHGWTIETVPGRIRSAIYLVFGALYEGRTALDEILTDTVKALVHRDRDPALA